MVNETKQSKVESFDKSGEGEKEVILEGKKERIKSKKKWTKNAKRARNGQRVQKRCKKCTRK